MKFLVSFALFCWTAFPAQASLWTWFNPTLRKLETQDRDLEARLEALPPMPALQHHERSGGHSWWASSASGGSWWVQVDLGVEMELDSVVVVPAFFNGKEAYGFPLRFRLDASRDPEFSKSSLLLDQTSQDCHATAAPWHVRANGIRARYVRFTATRIQMENRAFWCLDELMVFSGGHNVALHAKVTAPSFIETFPMWSKQYLVDGWSALGLPALPIHEPGNGWLSHEVNRPNAVKWVQVDLGDTYPLDEIRLIPAYPSDFPDKYGFGFPLRFKIETSETVDFSNPRMVFDSTASDFTNPSHNSVAFRAGKAPARYIRVTATHLWERWLGNVNDYIFALGELQAWMEGQNLALGSKVTCNGEYANALWSHERLVDGKVPNGLLVNEEDWLAQLSERREIETAKLQLLPILSHEESIAKKRVTWAGGLSLAGLGLLAVAGSLRGRHLRKQEMEALRQRIARDLHDEVGSNLACIALLTSEGENQPSEVSTEILTEIRQVAEETSASMRDLVWVIQPGVPGDMAEGLQQVADRLLRGLNVEFHAPLKPLQKNLSPTFKREVYLIFREMLQNIVRHSHATSVKVHFKDEDWSFHLTVSDNGCGFHVSNLQGHGLSNMRERSRRCGGVCEIHSAPGEGCEVQVRLPWQ